jgi:MFS family permease
MMNDKFKYNLRVFITFGILFEVMNSLYHPFAVKFLERVGGTDFHISLLNSMKGVVMIFTALPAAFLINRIVDKKKITGSIIMMMAFLILTFVFVPFLPQKYQALSFISINALLMIPIAGYNIGYQNILGELFPKRRARVISKRSMYTVVFTTTVTIISGLIFKFFANTHSDYIRIYQIFYMIAFIVGISSVVVLKKLDYQTIKEDIHYSFKGSFKKVFKNKRYSKFVLSSTIFHFGWQMGWPLFSIYMIRTLGADELWISVISVGSAIVMFFSYRFWPGMIERFGNEKVSTICTFGMAITPLLHIVSKTLPVLAVVSTLSGFFTAGTITVLASDMLEVVPEKNRAIYVGYYNIMTNFTLIIAPLVGHYFNQNNGIIFALVVTSIFRFIGGIAFFIREHSERKYLMT